ncbi:hypothetical protein [Phenylobacterium sp.]|uniref:hypothetical protein n=1 Tax=Phenylobacterium sp. TaxID=1871053 RepID=UPI0035B1018A
MAQQSDRLVQVVPPADLAGEAAHRDAAEIVAFPTTRKAPAPVPRLELLGALFAAMHLAGGVAAPEALMAIVAGAMPQRDEAMVRQEIEALIDYYSVAQGDAPLQMPIFERLDDGRIALGEVVRNYLA